MNILTGLEAVVVGVYSIGGCILLFMMRGSKICCDMPLFNVLEVCIGRAWEECFLVWFYFACWL